MGLVTMEANYFYPHHRSQKTSALQKDSDLYAANCGMSLQGLFASQILGYSTTPTNVEQLKADLSKDHANYIERSSFECRKTKTKVITLSNHKEHRLYSEPIKTRSNYM